MLMLDGALSPKLWWNFSFVILRKRLRIKEDEEGERQKLLVAPLNQFIGKQTDGARLSFFVRVDDSFLASVVSSSDCLFFQMKMIFLLAPWEWCGGARRTKSELNIQRTFKCEKNAMNKRNKKRVRTLSTENTSNCNFPEDHLPCFPHATRR